MLFKNTLGKISNKFLIYGFGQVFNLVTPIVIAPYLVLVCNLDGFGKIGIAFAFALFLILVVDYGFDIKGIKKISESRNSPTQLQNELVITLYTKSILFIISGIIGVFFIFFIPYFYNESLLFLFSLTIVFAQIFNPSWFLQGLEDFYTTSILNACSKVLYVILVFIIIKEDNNYIYVNLLLGLCSLTVNVIGLIYVFRKNNFKLLTPNFKSIFVILKNDFSLCLSQLFLSVRQLSPLFIVGYLFGYNVAGQYKILDQIISLYRTLSQVFLKFFYPQLCYRLNEDKKDALKYWKKYTLVLFCGIFFSSTILFFLSNEVLVYFSVEKEIITHLSILLKLALIIPIAIAFSLSFEQLMFGLHNNKLYFKITLFVTFFNVVTILLLSNFFNLSGIIISIFLSEILFIYLYYQGAYKKILNNES